VNRNIINIEDSKIFNFILKNKIIIFLYFSILVLFILGTILSRGFISYDHVLSILRIASFLGIVSMGQTVVILTGGIDLSVGSLITMGNLFTCMFINGINSNTLWVLIVIILLGSLFGSFNGFGIAYLKIPPLVMTLALGSVLTGINLIFTRGAGKGLASPILRYISTGRLFDFISLIILIWAVLSVFFILLLNSFTFGRKIYYIGANEKAAFLSGIKTNLIKTLAYSISGATSSLTGALMAGYTVTAFLGIGNEYILWSITAVVIGGTSLTGGKGGYLGTIAGCILLVLIESILTVAQIPEAGRRIANGLLILILISIYFKKR